jgi:hypothetical protein
MKSKLSAAVAAFSIIAAYAALAGSTAARADLVTFTLSDVRFVTLGSASGSFTLDTSIPQKIVTVGITTSADAFFPGTSYTDPALTQILTFTTGNTRYNFNNTSGFRLELVVAGIPPSFTIATRRTFWRILSER